MGEYYIAKMLIDNQINFLYNKKYSFTGKTKLYRYDFYLPQINYYIEYAGMLINGLIKNKIILCYDIRMKNKILLCKKNNFNLFVSSDYLTVIEFIKTRLK